MHFVRRDNYNVHAAACRLVKYWKIRHEFFGDERAFLPLIQTGRGALTRDDVVVLNCGVLALLPNDQNGRGVLMKDRNLLLDDNLEIQQSKFRGLFYILSLLCENEVNRDDGFVWLEAVIMPRVRDICREHLTQSLEIVDCFPIRLKAAHLLVIPPKAGKRTLIASIVDTTKNLFEEHFGSRAILTRATTAADMASELAEFGFEEQSIPMTLGGNWMYEEWLSFLRQQCRDERAFWEGSGVPENSTHEVPSRKRSKPLSDAERKERKRKLNTIHSRLKRERQRAEVSRLDDDCREIESRNSALEADNIRLEILLVQAKTVLLQQGFLSE